MGQIKALTTAKLPQMIEIRRYFRKYPELSGAEFNTQRKIMTELAALGLTPQAVADTGVVADIVGRADGPLIAIRADTDALPIQDAIMTPYCSQNHGVCHACGHDGHSAMLLGAAGVLKALQSSLPGTVRLIFQPSEEVFSGGAQAVIAAGVLEHVTAIIGAHLWQPLPVGTIGITSGKLMAAPDEFVITIVGRGGHGSMPQQTIDPILTASQLVVALHTIIGRSLDPLEPAVLSVGMFNAGEAFNVIPECAIIKGTVRTFDPEVRSTVFERIRAIAAGVCQAAGAKFNLEQRYGVPPVINNPAIAAVCGQAASTVVGRAAVVAPQPVMVGEDFSLYLAHAAGCFALIGAGNEAAGFVYPHHHPSFDFDEQALAVGAEFFCRSALKLLSEPL